MFFLKINKLHDVCFLTSMKQQVMIGHVPYFWMISHTSNVDVVAIFSDVDPPTVQLVLILKKLMV